MGDQTTHLELATSAQRASQLAKQGYLKNEGDLKSVLTAPVSAADCSIVRKAIGEAGAKGDMSAEMTGRQLYESIRTDYKHRDLPPVERFAQNVGETQAREGENLRRPADALAEMLPRGACRPLSTK